MSVNRLTFWTDWVHSYVIRKERRWNPILSVRTEIEIVEDLNVTSLSKGLDEANLNREVFKALLEKAQEELVNELCGRRYGRDEERRFKRAGTTDRTLITRYGKIEFKLVKVKSMENGSIMRPLLLYLGVDPWRRVVDDLDFECAETASYLTYRDSKTVIETLTKAEVSRHRIHSYVQKVGSFIDKERRRSEERR